MVKATPFCMSKCFSFCYNLMGSTSADESKKDRKKPSRKLDKVCFVRCQLNSKKTLKENMTIGLMPKSVGPIKKRREILMRRQSSDSTNDIRSIFRPFNMDHMENASIPFDIAGFTKMSSNKSRRTCG
ncbi:hypothetical protein JTB14_000118 [Gonioctena quinquepunctata]|nr:hypothetical protein JTB14_000118 [Gonioctena quinquepunctata]